MNARCTELLLYKATKNSLFLTLEMDSLVRFISFKVPKKYVKVDFVNNGVLTMVMLCYVMLCHAMLFHVMLSTIQIIACVCSSKKLSN